MKKRLVKQTLAQVKAHIRKQGVWEGTVAPCKIHPNSELAGKYISFNQDELSNGNFEKWINEFTYYNCSNETGSYPSYYHYEYEETAVKS